MAAQGPGDFTDAVLDLVARIPPGRVLTYGDVAELLGRPPLAARAVGQVMRRWGGGVPWWRVVNAHGELPHDHLEQARRRWDDEAVPRTREGRVDVSAARWDGDDVGQASTAGT